MRWRLIVCMFLAVSSATFWFLAGGLWTFMPMEAVLAGAGGTLSGLLAISFAQDDGRMGRGE